MKNGIISWTLVTFCLVIGFSTANTHSPILIENPTGGAYLTFAGKFGGNITLKNLKKYDTVEVAGCAKGSKIFKFTLHISKKGKKSTYSTKSSNLTKEMITQLQSLKTGDEFRFKQVEAYLPNGKDKVNVWSKTFYVVK